MTDLVIAVRLKADGTGLVGQLKLSKDEVDKLKVAQQSAAGAARQLGAATDQLGNAETRAAGKARQHAAAQRESAAASGQMRFALIGVGQQLQDGVIQLQAGQRWTTVFAQQGSQAAFMLAGLEGKVGAVARVIAGPFGAALFATLSILPALILGFKDAGDAADDMAQDQFDLGVYVDATTGKIREQITATQLLAAAQAGALDAEKKRQAYLDAKSRLIRAGTIHHEETILPLGFDRGFGPITSLGTRPVGLSAGEREINRQTELLRQGKISADAYGQAIQKIGESNPQLRKVTDGLVRLTANTIDAAQAGVKAEAGVRILSGTASEADRKLLGFAAAADRASGERGRPSGGGGGHGGSGLRGVGSSADEAAKSMRELDSDLDALIRRFDPATSAADAYADTLAKIARLQGAGKITDLQAMDFSFKASQEEAKRRLDEADRFANDLFKDAFGGKDIAAAFDDMIAGIETDLDAKVKPEMEKVGRAGGDAFRVAGIDAAQAIAQIFGGEIGGVLGPILGALSGTRTGNFNSVGGPLGGLLTLLSGGGGADNPFTRGLQSVFAPIEDQFKSLTGRLDGIFGIHGSFTETLGKAAGFGAIGGAAGSLTGSGPAGALGGAVGGFAGEALKKTFDGIFKGLGQFAGPIGSLVGGVLGGLVGGLFHKTKTGVATITGLDTPISTSGNSDSRRHAAEGLAGSVQDALQQIADQLGGGIGDFAVSIGIRDKQFRVDPTGQGQTKKKKGAIDFDEDQAAAVAFAIADAIRDGAITGLSAAVQKALQSSTDIDKALREALKVDEVETLLGGIGAELEKTFQQFERQAAERVRIARQYGFDLVKLEQVNAEQRAKVFEDVLQSRIGSLQQLLDDLNFGDLFEGSAADQRQALLVQIAKAKSEAEAGKEGAADTLAQLERKLVDLSRDAFGTAGAEFASDRAGAKSAAEEIIKIENDRVKAAQDAAIATNQKLDTNNQLTNETNDLLAETNALLRGMGGAAVSGGGSVQRFTTGRQVRL